MRVAGLQLDLAWEDPPANYAAAAEQIAVAAAAGARLVILPELFATGFTMAAERVAEPDDGPSTRFLVEQAGRHQLWVGGTVARRSSGDRRPANTFVLAGPCGVAARYDKLHPFTSSGEHEHYRAGEGFCTVDVEGVRTTLFVCYDLRFADEFWVTGPGTDLFVVPANWPASRAEQWVALLRARAVENQCYVLGVNRVGRDGNGLDHRGDTMLVDPSGATLASAARQQGAVVGEVDAGEVARVRERWPFLRDRR